MRPDPRPALTVPLRRGLTAGLLSGLTFLAGMELLSVLGLTTLPDLLQGQILSALPGPVFGFLIDNLQHLGKVAEQAGLELVLLLVFVALGALQARLPSTWRPVALGLLALASSVLLLLAMLSTAAPRGSLAVAGQTLGWTLLVALSLAVMVAFGAPRSNVLALDTGRRRFIASLSLGLGALAVLGGRLGPAWVQAVIQPPESGVNGLSPELTPASRFYVVSKNFRDPVVSAEGWRLEVRGLVTRPLLLSYGELLAMPQATEFVTLECISNRVGGGLISTGRFGGVRLRDLVERAQPRQNGAALVFHSSHDGYRESLPLDYVLRSPEILVAHELNGAPLPDSHGFPARLLVPGRYGLKGPKWLTEIDLVEQARSGCWERQGWDPEAVVRTTSRFDVPHDGAVLPPGPVELTGIAFAGSRGVSAVEVSADGSRSWQLAEVEPPLSRLAWARWRLRWSAALAGHHRLSVRARDGDGHWQDAAQEASYPAGASGYHSIRITVGRR